LQEAQENAQKGLHRLDMEFIGVRVQSGQDMVRMQIPGNLEVKLDQINSQMASLRQVRTTKKLGKGPTKQGTDAPQSLR